MIILADIREPSVARQIHALLQAAYAVEARRIGCDDFPPLHETVAGLGNCADYFLIYFEAGEIAGCLSYQNDAEGITITRLVVSPPQFRRGIASALLRELERCQPPGTVICGMTADLNEPAVRAYEKCGYSTEAAPASRGIALRRVRKQIGGAG